MSYQAGPAPAPRSNAGAIVAIVIGIVLFGCILFTAILAAFLFPVFAKSRERARRAQCMSNVRQQTLTVQMYQQDHNGQFPSKDTIWADLKLPEEMFTCPTYGSDKGNGYGYNASLSGKTLSSNSKPFPQEIPVLADSAAPGNLLHTTTDIDFRHENRASIGYADGHVKSQPSSGITNLPFP